MSYKFLLTNGPKGDLLHHHFSADEFYLLPILIVAMLIHFLILGVTILFAVTLKSRQLFHSTYKLFLLAVSLHVSNFMITNGYIPFV